MVSCFRKKWQTKREKKTWRRARSRKITTGKKLRPYKLIRIWFWKNWVFYLTSKASLQNRRNFLVFFRRTEASGRRTWRTSHVQGKTRVICSSLSPSTCLRWTEKREKVTPILQADHRLKKGTVGFKSGITPDCFFSPFKHKKVLHLEVQKLDLRPW